MLTADQCKSQPWWSLKVCSSFHSKHSCTFLFLVEDDKVSQKVLLLNSSQNSPLLLQIQACTIRFWPLWFSNLLLSLSMSTVYCLATSLCMLSYLLTELLMDLIVSLVVEVQRCLVKKSKMFGKKTICSKETIIFWKCNECWFMF